MGTALVTGASSGIGRDIALRLDVAGHHVILVARSRGPLEELAALLTNATVLVADLSTSEGLASITSTVPRVDILVNNAGFGDTGPFATSDTDFALSMIRVNAVALTALTRHFLPGMLEQHSGRILNIASTAAFQPGPNMAVYYASKAYVLSFTEAIAEEIRGSGVSATAFCPGPFSSGFQKTAHAENIRLNRFLHFPTSAQMATAAIDAMQRGEVVSVPGWTNKAGAAAVRFAPRPLLRRIVGQLNK